MKLKRGVWRVSDKVKKKKEKKGGEKKFGRNGRLIDVETWRCLQRMNRQEKEREREKIIRLAIRVFVTFMDSARSSSLETATRRVFYDVSLTASTE